MGQWPRTLLLVLALAGAFVGGGCKKSSESPGAHGAVGDGDPQTEKAVSYEEVASLKDGESLILENRLFLLAGEIDQENLYPSAVMVLMPDREEVGINCSGVAISRRVILTAGHCVCAQRKSGPPEAGGGAIIDTGQCAGTANVVTLVYIARTPDGNSGARSMTRQGVVHPHPELKIVLDEQGRVVSSHADLALVVLKEPVEVQPVAVTDEEARVDDSVLMVGYGYDEVVDVFGHERRVSVNRVTKILEPGGERIQVEQPGKHRYRMDSGGPCFVKKRAGPVLVGISSRWLGEGATFVGTHGYRDWLRREIQRAESQ
jgi:hypothetical protein